jgi:hypothetical protein
METDAHAFVGVTGKSHRSAAAGATEAELKELIHFGIGNAPERLLEFDPYRLRGKTERSRSFHSLHSLFVCKLTRKTVFYHRTAALAKEKATEVYRVILAEIGLTAKTAIHSCDKGGLFQRSLDKINGKRNLFRLVGNINVKGQNDRSRILFKLGIYLDKLFEGLCILLAVSGMLDLVHKNAVELAGERPTLIVKVDYLGKHKPLKADTVGLVLITLEAYGPLFESFLVEIEDVTLLVDIGSLKLDLIGGVHFFFFHLSLSFSKYFGTSRSKNLKSF